MSTTDKGLVLSQLRKSIGEIVLNFGSDEWISMALERSLLSKEPNSLGEYFSEYGELFNDTQNFHTFMRKKFKEKGISHQTIFIAADISYGYGCKILSGEKNTRQRDIIIKICVAAKFQLSEIRQALLLYQMPSLDPKSRRDAVIMVSIANNIYDIEKINALLSKYSLEKLYSCREINNHIGG